MYFSNNKYNKKVEVIKAILAVIVVAVLAIPLSRLCCHMLAKVL